MHFHPVFAILVIPLTLLLGLCCIPYLRYETDSSGVWFVSGKGRVLALWAFIIAIATTIAAVVGGEMMASSQAIGPPDVINTGLVPFMALVGVCTGFYILLKKVFKANNNEAIQALFTLLMTAFVVLTCIGIWFRGTGMQLMWAG